MRQPTIATSIPQIGWKTGRRRHIKQAFHTTVFPQAWNEMDFLYNASEPSNASEELPGDGNETDELDGNMSHWRLV